MIAPANNSIDFTSDKSSLWSIASQTIQPTQFSSIVDWLGDGIHLNTEVEADVYYDLISFPFWCEILQSITDPEVDSIAILGCTQLGKTLMQIVAAFGVSFVDPAPAMFVMPTQDEAAVIRDRIYANAEVNPLLAKRVPPKHLRNMKYISLHTMKIYLAWSGSIQRLRGKPCKIVWLSEIDAYDYSGEHGDPNKTAERRTDQFFDSTIIRESTPVGELSRIFAYWERGDKRRWHVECPHCGRFQWLGFFPNKEKRGGIVGWQDGSGGVTTDLDAARANAKYICSNGCEIDSSDKALMIRGGQWVPEGQRIVDGKLIGEPKKSGTHRSYHLWQVMNPKKSFGDIATAYVDAKTEGNVREFYQDVLGWRYRSTSKLPTWEVVASKFSDEYRVGSVPQDVWFATGACDVQENRVYWAVLGWGPNRTPYLLDFGVFYPIDVAIDLDSDSEIVVDSDLSQVRGLLDSAWPCVAQNQLGLTTIVPRVFGIDSNYRTHSVHDLVRSVQSPRLIAVRGDHKVSPTEKFRVRTVEKNSRTGKVYEGGLKQWGIYVDHYREKWDERLSGPANQAGSLRLPKDLVDRGGKQLLRQLVNEERRPVKNASGRSKMRYVVIDENVGVDYRDIFVYCEAEADMVVGKLGWSEESWEQWKIKTEVTKKRVSPSEESATSVKSNRNRSRILER